MKSTKRISKINSFIDGLATAMTEDEYRKAVEFHKFLVSITGCNKAY